MMKNRNDFNSGFLRDLEKYNWSLIHQNSNCFEEELKKEITGNHFLFSKELTAIAKDNASDDVLFVEKNTFYILHLTYTLTNEERFPQYEIFESMQELEQYFSKNYIDSLYLKS
ncbi:MAG: hypothetical protein Q4A49_01895 [Neisseria sp.]|nr:hypothetical protein [Neisseria sp.]